ncbi:cell division control protein 16 [Coprinopsis cinerea okayama7|uniref:Cell division control protein 16 n=1 Tax=Coprinopsis cinerea (strain Okayama-7 / 130 / ATCC MYA-4618 / FGSC 9003) TaxID=240176 RepID=A8NTC5_COPC7|nr:cell division control protein 16 [Coprinopsis cinerea okayama7\|eukprot:XP_001836195.2 cell division control protein 16 [Coprinopsis cinerea okayama7\
MTSTPPPSNQYTIPGIPSLPSPSSSRPRGSIGSSFSFNPSHLMDSFAYDSNASMLSTRFGTTAALDPNRSILASSPARASPWPKPKRKGKDRNTGAANLLSSFGGPKGRQQHPLANDTTDVFNDSDDDADVEDDGEESYEWGMVDRMRLWRHDALMQHLYETAAFWGDKILSWTNDPNDAFWLAQTYFMTHQYSRAYRLLTRPFPSAPNASAQRGPVDSDSNNILPANLTSTGSSGSNSNPNLTAQPSPTKGKAKEIQLSAERAVVAMPRLPMGTGGLVEVPESLQESTSRLVDLSLACRYLAAQCMVRSGKWTEAMELIGDSNPFRGSTKSGPAIANTDGGIKIEASMCYLRGLLMLKLNRADQAKTCFMEALALDVKCADAFSMLMNAEMLTPDEEWEFIQGLSYSTQTPEDAEFVQLIYTSRLRKDKHHREHELTRMRLVDDYGLGDNPDVLFSFADALYASFRWAECFAITSRIMSLTSIHVPTLPLHIACMYHLNHLHSKLFLLAHEMVDREPENPLSWYAVGVWYLTNGKWSQARAYLSKTTLMDPRFAPAWAAFGHTFALEAEHEHAVTAYSTCARIFAGSHLPLLFIGMEQIKLSNYRLADEALAASHALCADDPLLCNERGVMAFNHGDYEKAAALFEEAIAKAEITQSSQKTWAVTYINLGTSLRKLRRYKEALDVYKKVLEYDPRNATALGLLGMVHHLLNELDQAILRYHEALSIEPINANILELLNMALESTATTRKNMTFSEAQEQEFMAGLAEIKQKWARLGHGKTGTSSGAGTSRAEEDAMQI